jgi:hypothetical protein
MTVSQRNRMRYRAVLLSRAFKQVFLAPPERFAKALLGRFLLGPLLRWLFLGPDGQPHRAGESVLAELRRKAGLNRRSNFDPDPHVMAYREGQRALVQEIFNYLNLDEGAVRKLMEIDDGLD